MFKILLLLAASIGLGFLLRKFRPVVRFSGAVQYTVYVMLLVFGLTIGANREIMARLGEFGIQAVILAAAGVLGSILAVYLFTKAAAGKKEKP